MRIKVFSCDDLDDPGDNELQRRINKTRQDTLTNLRRCGLPATAHVLCKISSEYGGDECDGSSYYVVVKGIPFRVWWSYCMKVLDDTPSEWMGL